MKKSTRVQVALMGFNVYLIFVFIFGAHGLVRYYNLQKQYDVNSSYEQKLAIDVKSLQNKSSLLNANNINMLFLEEKIRIEFGLANRDEYVVLL